MSRHVQKSEGFPSLFFISTRQLFSPIDIIKLISIKIQMLNIISAKVAQPLLMSMQALIFTTLVCVSLNSNTKFFYKGR